MQAEASYTFALQIVTEYHRCVTTNYPLQQSKQDKETMRPLYDKYRLVKKFIAKGDFRKIVSVIYGSCTELYMYSRSAQGIQLLS